ncbi:unnamed protein product [Zymoseptoria tritici ST99CH_1A5]|uniref:Uncharacterized protein n=3 Tax=Zymoseptoria tritici TaxID=1047171 RepID=F9X1T9_ZYMTI|nr:uncharacterized protein MYCGRDRAFT_91066 [Zymoseptoria tritici IPO323]EGP90337.1 hypothetical protein MYCGRDRAFT_91066 [Zymoseptoria tritici IPO323]SMY21708.1 unnamed protein product [Zymoseptoria tritici ST99CH_1A5]
MDYLRHLVRKGLIDPGAVDIAQAQRDPPNFGIGLRPVGLRPQPAQRPDDANDPPLSENGSWIVGNELQAEDSSARAEVDIDVGIDDVSYVSTPPSSPDAEDNEDTEVEGEAEEEEEDEGEAEEEEEDEGEEKRI